MGHRKHPKKGIDDRSEGSKKTPDLVLVVPCHNEAKRLIPERFLAFLDTNPSARLLFVDDCSGDDTPNILRNMVSLNPRCEVIHLEKNIGKAGAVFAGFQKALDAPWGHVGYWDADLATPLDASLELATILEKGQYDYVLGSRVARIGSEIKRKASRHYVGRVYATLISLVLGMRIYDTQCGAKLFRKTEALKKAFSEPFTTKWVFDVELLARLKKFDPALPERVYEHPLSKWTDVPGSKVSLYDGIVALVDLLRIWSAYG